MRITFYNLRAHGLFDPDDKTVFGGAEVQLFHLSVGLAARGHDVSFVTRGPGPRTTSIISGVKVHKIPARSGRVGKCLTLWEILWVLLACRAQVYVQRCAGLETAMVAWLSRLLGRRFCFMTASLLDCRDQLAQEGRPWLYEAYLWGLRRADMVICQNEEQQRLLHDNFGIDADVLRSACAPVEGDSTSAVPEDERRVLWVGRCDSYKDPVSFIQLARELPQIRFRMIMPRGDHPAYGREVEKELPGLSNLEVSRGLPFHEMETAFRSASILVNTSTLEGFPNSFLEAMRMGVPILSYRLDPGGVFARQGAGICVQADFRSLVSLCEAWHQSSDEARRYGQAGREYVGRTHDSRIVVEELEHLLRKCEG